MNRRSVLRLPLAFAMGCQSPRTSSGRQASPDALAPGHPIPFGFKNAWYAIRATNVNAVADAFGLRARRQAAWSLGIERSAEGNEYFVAPPVKGWILLVGTGLGVAYGSEQRPFEPVVGLSRSFGEAQAFCTHRVVELHVWAKASSGRLLRAYGYVGESGETLYDEGVQTPEEKDLGFKFFDERSAEANSEAYWDRKDLTFPSEESVMSIARRWSIAPVDLGPSSAGPATGLLGTLD